MNDDCLFVSRQIKRLQKGRKEKVIIRYRQRYSDRAGKNMMADRRIVGIRN